MSLYIGIDTSNYTTSLAVYDSENNKARQYKMLLPVKGGQLGLRQSDAVFHHTQQLHVLFEKLFCEFDNRYIDAIGVSSRPRNLNGSYMPCFTSGESVAKVLGYALKRKVYETSHQVGHILSALYSSEKLELINEQFIAFHVSGGTTDCLLINPSSEYLLQIKEIGTSLDLKAGQAVDRVGLMLGLKFPCGKELEKLALLSDKEYKVKPVLKDNNCCLSGLENKCKNMLDSGESKVNIAKYCLQFISETIKQMTYSALKQYNNLPILYAGGVMSDMILQNNLAECFQNAFFAKPEYSCDNAVGTALYAYLRSIK